MATQRDIEVVRFTSDPLQESEEHTAGSAVFLGAEADDDTLVRWRLGPEGFGAWNAGNGLGLDPQGMVWRETKRRACDAAGVEAEATPDIRTQAGAAPHTDINGLVLVPHWIATHGAGDGTGRGSAAFDAYVAYCDARGWTLPRWDELHDGERRAWAQVAGAVQREGTVRTARALAKGALAEGASPSTA